MATFSVFKCNKCKEIVSISSSSLAQEMYGVRCPKCGERDHLYTWNPLEGHCPKCNGRMEIDKFAGIIMADKSKFSMNRERFIFLDFDGVLNTMEYQTALQWKGHGWEDNFGNLFDPTAVENLKFIIDNTSAKIVVTSSWRLDGIEKMRELWKNRNLPGEIAGVTPHLNQVCFNSLDGGKDTFSVIPYGTRGLEINEWLRINAESLSIICSYVIIDDFDDFISSQHSHFVLTDPETGLTRELAEQVVAMLK